MYYLVKLLFQILWKSRFDILVSFTSHLKKKIHPILRLLLEKLNCGFFQNVSLVIKYHLTNFHVKIAVENITIKDICILIF